MTLPRIEESPSSGDTQDSDTGNTTRGNFQDVFQRLQDLEQGQSTLGRTVEDLRREISRLTAAVSQAFHTPGQASQTQHTPTPSPVRQSNQYQEREYLRYQNPEKQPLFDEGPSQYHQRPPDPHRLQPQDRSVPPLELTKKLEVPIFSGENAFAWLSKAERFFRLADYSDENKFHLVAVSLDGVAIGWFNGEMNSDPFTSWNNFKDRLLLRFADVHSRGPAQSICCLQQVGSAAEFVARFEDLAGQVTNLDAQTLEGVFLNGLKGALRSTVEMMKPTSLTEMKAYALTMDASPLTRLITKELQGPGRFSRSLPPTEQRPQAPTPWKQREFVQSQRPGDSTKPGNQYADNKDLEEKKRLGLCFKCSAKYTRDHWRVCPNRQIKLLTLVNGYEMEILDNNMECMADTAEEVFEECEEPPVTVAQLSLNSFLGVNTASTTKIRVTFPRGEVIALVDSGATHNFVSPDTVSQLRLPSENANDITVFLGTGISASGLGVARNIEFSVTKQATFSDDFIILELGDADIILGVQWLSKLGTCHCNWQTNELSFLYKDEVVQLWGERNLTKTRVTDREDRGRFRRLSSGLRVNCQPLNASPSAVTAAPPAINATLTRFAQIFDEPKSLPPIRNREHTIQLVPGTKAISVRPYRYPHAYKTIIETLVAEMLHSGVIRPSKSPFSSPVLLVRKKDNSWRFCVDYRALNRVTIADKFPIPVIDQLLDELHGAAVFSKLDLRAGYHQIRMSESDIHKTAFRTHEGHYEFCVMPFGLMNAPASFQALMNEIFRPLLRRFVLIFFDDILIFSRTMEEHNGHLTAVLELLRVHSLFANKTKCVFAKPKIDYLGHIISEEGVATDPAKTEAVRNWPTPKCIKDLRGFLGLTGYYRRFVEGYGGVAKPLTDLLKKDSFSWSATAQDAFDDLKTRMCRVPVLKLPDFTIPFVVETDASSVGLGAVLQQQKRPIAFFSYGLTPREQLKSTYERELMAIVMSINKWRHYLLGRRFVVVTDQQSLKHLLEQKEIAGSYQKWVFKLLHFDFEIHYKPGKNNQVADALSRRTTTTTSLGRLELWGFTVANSTDRDAILAEAAEDDELKKIKSDLQTGGFSKPGYSIKENRVWFKNRLVIPKTSRFIPLLISECHSELAGGHAGVRKTTKKLRQFIHWQGLKTDVERFVSQCSICQTHKTSTLSPAGLLQPLPIPTAIWEDISLDFIDGLPLSHGANSILVVVDRLSKFAHFIGLRHPYSAQDVAHKFAVEIVRLHGLPASIVSDRDKIFLSQFWKDLFKLSGTKLKFSTAYHPETDGQTEVLNRCLESYLRCFASAKPKTWNKFLHWAELWYNSSYHTSLKSTPFRVVYGRDPPPLLRFESGSTKNFELEQELRQRDEHLRLIRDNLSNAQQRMKHSADKHRRHQEFAPGQLVYLKLRAYRQQSLATRICKKLAAKYFGPFRIKDRVGQVAYRLELPPTARIHNVFHVSLLKEARGHQNAVTTLPQSLLETEDLVVEPALVRDTRYNATGHLEALVHWKGFSEAEDEWVNAKQLLQRFPNVELGDKIPLKGGSIDRPFRVYFRKPNPRTTYDNELAKETQEDKDGKGETLANKMAVVERESESRQLEVGERHALRV